MEQVDAAQAHKDFVVAKTLLQTARALRRQADPNGVEDPTMIQRLALMTYKSQQPTPKDALHEAKSFLQLLNPETSNDTETLGLWGAIHKRLWELGKGESDLNEAVRAYERGFYLRNDYYNGINFAYLLNVRAAHSSTRSDAIADFVQAQRVRKEVLSITQTLNIDALPAGEKYWVMTTIAEAHFGLGNEAEGQTKLQEAFALATLDWMKESTQEQMDKLRQLISDSPLKYIMEA